MKYLIGLIFLYPALLLAQTDTLVSVQSDQSILLKGTVISATSDTTLALNKQVKYSIIDTRQLKSQVFYDSLYAKASKTKITKSLYKLFITRPPSMIKTVDYEKSFKSESFFSPFEGKRIASIRFLSVDVFEGSVYDTLKRTTSSIVKLTNNIHQNTTKNVIRNQLLFSKGDRVDKFEVADSERLLRSLRYIEDARILIKQDKNNDELVEVIIVTKDRFPWSLTGSGLTNNGYRIDLVNRNALGSGNEFNLGFRHSDNNKPANGYDLSYTIRNIKRSFINTTLFLADNHTRRGQGIIFRRNFVSPSIKYIGEAIFEKVSTNQDFIFADSLLADNFTHENAHADFWLARSFSIGKRNNIGASLRLSSRDYKQRPEVKIDSNEFYFNNKIMLGSVFISRINFLKSQNIYSFSITEDIPVGYLHTLIFGPQWTDFGRRYYAGARSNYSWYTKFGFLQVNAEYGFFLQTKASRNTTFQINNVYFSPLFSLGSSAVRFYLRTNYFEGKNLSVPFSGSLSDEDNFREFSGTRINGDRVISANLEAILFTSWFFYGFRFAPFAYIDHGYVKESRLQEPFERLYSGIGGGFRIKNEGLILNTFEIRFTAYPSFPENSQRYSLQFSFATPRLFKNPSIRKPKLAGVER